MTWFAVLPMMIVGDSLGSDRTSVEHGAGVDHDLEGPVERGGLDVGVAHDETIGIRSNETHEVLFDVEQDARKDRAASCQREVTL